MRSCNSTPAVKQAPIQPPKPRPLGKDRERKGEGKGKEKETERTVKEGERKGTQLNVEGFGFRVRFVRVCTIMV